MTTLIFFKLLISKHFLGDWIFVSTEVTDKTGRLSIKLSPQVMVGLPIRFYYLHMFVYMSPFLRMQWVMAFIL